MTMLIFSFPKNFTLTSTKIEGIAPLVTRYLTENDECPLSGRVSMVTGTRTSQRFFITERTRTNWS